MFIEVQNPVLSLQGTLGLHLLQNISPYMEQGQLLSLCERLLSRTSPGKNKIGKQQEVILTGVLQSVLLPPDYQEKFLLKPLEDDLPLEFRRSLKLSDSSTNRLIELSILLNSNQLDCILYAVLVQRMQQCNLAILKGIQGRFVGHFGKQPFAKELEGMFTVLEPRIRAKKLVDPSLYQAILPGSTRSEFQSGLSEDCIVRLLIYCLSSTTAVRVRIASLLIQVFNSAQKHFTSSSTVADICAVIEEEADPDHVHQCLYLIRSYLARINQTEG